TSHLFFFPPITPPPPPSTLFPYTTLFRSILEPAPNLHPARLEVAVSFPDENHLLLAGVEDRIRRHNDGHSAGRRHLHVGEHAGRSEEHTSELQSPYDLVCRLLLEKKKKKT